MTVHQITARDRMFKAAREAKEQGKSEFTISVYACEQLIKEFDAMARTSTLERDAKAFIARKQHDRMEIAG